jgi:hypothetical protein
LLNLPAGVRVGGAADERSMCCAADQVRVEVGYGVQTSNVSRTDAYLVCGVPRKYRQYFAARRKSESAMSLGCDKFERP